MTGVNGYPFELRWSHMFISEKSHKAHQTQPCDARITWEIFSSGTCLFYSIIRKFNYCRSLRSVVSLTQ